MNKRTRNALLGVAYVLDQAAQAIRRYVKRKTPRRVRRADVEATAA